MYLLGGGDGSSVLTHAKRYSFSKIYPGYDWENNMGYGTKSHNSGIKKNGLTPIHRLSFSPMKKVKV